MTVYRRDYAREWGSGPKAESAWAYTFSYQKVRYRKSGFLSKREAEMAEQRARKEVIFDGKRLVPLRYATLLGIRDEYVDYRRIERAEKTCRTEKGHSTRLFQALGSKRLDLITKAHVMEYIRARNKEGVSNRTINIELTVLRQMLKYAVDQGYAISNPAQEIRNLKELKHEVQIFTDEQFWSLVRAADETRTGRELATWFYVRALAGLRENESFFLRWSDVDFERNRLRICPQLGNQLKNESSNRYVDMHPDLRAKLLEWKKDWDVLFDLRGRTHDWVFYNPNDPSQRTNGLRTAFRNAKKKAGLPWVNSRTFRHYFISKAVMAGVDLLTVARWVGHSSTDMINKIYGHLQPEHTAEQMGRIKFAVAV
ncbi:MAG TPA: site-specific integrase [Kiritimatiellia bacterium]|nr:site-specific integrase [Kiritimatiellia bacterium]